MNQKLLKLFTIGLFIINVLNVQAEGTKQFMPNSTDRLWLEMNVFANKEFGTYDATEKERIYIYMNAGEILHFGMKLPSGFALTDRNYISFRVKDPDGIIEFTEQRMVGSGELGYINTHSEAAAGPQGVKINGKKVTNGYNALSFEATKTGNYWIEFETWAGSIATYGMTNPNWHYERRVALEFFDATVTDSDTNLITNPGEPNVAAGRLWSKGWSFTTTSFTNYPVKADFYVFTADEFVNKVEYEMLPYSFSLVANSYGVQNDPALDYIEKAQSQDDDFTSSSDISEYRIFLNDPDRIVWENTKLPPPEVKVWFEDELIFDYDYNRNPLYLDINVDTVNLVKNKETDCNQSDITFFKIESNIDGFAAVLLDIDGGGYSTDGNDRALYLDMKKGLNYILWNCKNDNGDVVEDGSFTASATFLGRGPAHFPLYDVETVERVASSSIRPFNKLGPTIYWDDRKLTVWGDASRIIEGTEEFQLTPDNHVNRLWAFDAAQEWNQHNGNMATSNSWYNAIDLGLSKINVKVTTSTTKCVNGDAPYVGNIILNTPINTNYAYANSDFEVKFFDPNDVSLDSIEIISLPQNGDLYLNSVLVTVADTFTLADIGNLEYRPDTDFNGKDHFKWKGNSNYWSVNEDTVFMIVNTPPTVTEIDDQKICTNTDTEDILFYVYDAENETDPADLNIEPFSSDPLVIKNTEIQIVQIDDTTRQVKVTPEANTSGYAIIYIKVDDGYDEVIEEFSLYIGPSMDIIGDTTICVGEPLHLTAVEFGDSVSYAWQFNGATVDTNQILERDPFTQDSAGVYTLIVSNKECSASRNINVSLAPDITFVGDTSLCIGDELYLTANEAVADSFIWRKGIDTVDFTKVFDIAYVVDTLIGNDYTLKVVKGECSHTSDPFSIGVITRPDTNLIVSGGTVNRDVDGTVTVESSENGITYNAYIGGSLINSEPGDGGNISINIPANELEVGNNTVIIKAENNNCEVQLHNKAIIIVIVEFTIDPISDASINENIEYTSVLPNLSGDTPVGNVTYTISGDDYLDFSINSTTGVVTLLGQDFENPADENGDNIYEVIITATDEDGNNDSEDWTVTVQDAIEAASFSINTISDANADENVAYNIAAPGLTGDTPIGNVTYTLGGDDAALFTVDASTGEVDMVARDYENPQDNGSNNTYAVSLIATDDDGNTDSESWVVNVQDLTESATFVINSISNANINENIAYNQPAPGLTGDTPSGTVTYTLGGDDAALFTVDASTGEVDMIARDYENPQDNGSDNTYAVTLIATDDDGNTANKSWVVTVNDVIEVVSFQINEIADVTINENSTYVTLTPSITGSPIGDVTYTLGGDDAALFTVNASSGVVNMVSRNFESPADINSDNEYLITLIATDADGNTDDESWAVTINDVIEIASFAINEIIDANVNENAAYTSVTPVLTGDTPIGNYSYTISGDDAAAFTIDANTGVVSMIARNYENPEDVDINNIYSLTITITDSDGNTDSESWTVAVQDLVEIVTFNIDEISDATVDENSIYTSVTPSITGSPVGSITYTLGGADAADFTINSGSGVVSMIARSYEEPVDADSNNVYELTLIATDDDSNADVETWTVTVNDVLELSNFTIAEINDTAIVEGFAYLSHTPKLIGTPIGKVGYSLSGDDADDFTIDADSGKVSMIAKDYENPTDVNADNFYNLIINVIDEDNNADSEDWVVEIKVDTDNDGIPDDIDADDDNDGNPDTTDPNPLVPTSVDDAMTVTVGESETINILANDDFLPGADIFITDLSTGTATGTVLIDALTGNLTYTPTAAESNTEVTIDYQVWNFGDTPEVHAEATVTVTVNADSMPVANDVSVATEYQTARNIDVLFNDTGLDNTPVAVTISVVPDPAQGSAVLGANNTIDFTPASGFSGTATFEYTVTDADGDNDAAIVSVIVLPEGVTNYIPIADDFTESTYKNTSINIDVLSHVTGLNDGFGYLSIAVEPNNGTAIVNDDRTITFTPANSFTGQVTFDYRVADTHGDWDTGTITVNVQERPDAQPVANDDRVAASFNTARPIDVLHNDTGLEDTPLIVTISTEPNAAQGTASVNGDNTVIFTPTQDFVGLATFEYTVTDSDGDFDNAMVTVNVKDGINIEPVANNDTVSTYINTAININVLNNDTGLEDGLDTLIIISNPGIGQVLVNDDYTITYTPANFYKGTQTFTYEIYDVDGDFDVATVVVNVIEKPNFVPLAVDDKRATAINTARTINVLINDSGLEDGGIVVTSTTLPINGTIAVNPDNTVTYTPNADYLGTDTFNYRVADADGDADTATVTINVKLTNALPLAFNDTTSTYMNTSVSLNVLANDLGLEDGVDTLTIHLQPNNGTVLINEDNTITYTPNTWFIGTDSIQYKVDDVDGDNDIATVIITVEEKPNFVPVAVDDRRGTSIDTPVTVDVLVNDFGLDDGGISISSTVNPVNGTLEVNPDNTITYTPNSGYLGTDTFNYRVVDKDGDADTATVTITVKEVNYNPVAVNDTAETQMNKTVTVNVLNNDSGLEDGVGFVRIHTQPTNGTVSINTDNTLTYTPYNWYVGSDELEYWIEDVDGDYSIAKLVININEQANNQPLAVDDSRGTAINTHVKIDVLINDSGLEDGGIIVTASTQPSNGTATVNPDNTITYTPSSGYLGTDSFTYQVCDTDGDCDNATVTVYVKESNAVPVALNDTATTNMNTAVRVNVVENDLGLEDGLASVSIFTQPVNGSVTVHEDNTITYTPANWYLGTDSLKYMVSDVDGDYDIATLIINIQTKPNEVPAAVDDYRATAKNNPRIVDVLINDTGLGDGGISIEAVSTPANGSIVLNANNTITYTPSQDYLGTETFKYRVADIDGDADTALVTILVKEVNYIPVANNDAASTQMNTTVSVNVLANDTDLNDGIGSLSIFTQPQNGSVTVNADNTISYIPANWYVGTDSLEYMIADVDGDYDIATVVITIKAIQNAVPVAVDDNRATSVNSPVLVDVLFNDTGLEDGGIVVTSVSNPTNGIISVNANNEVLYTPNTDYLGYDTFDYQVCDADGDCDTTTVTINVKETNAVPIAVNDSVETYLNTDVVVHILNNDSGLEDGLQGISIYAQPVNGSVAVNADNTITYTPHNWYLGNDSLQYLITDMDGDYGLATVYISITEVPNAVPVAVDDSRGTVINTAVDVDVLVNDSGLEDGRIVVSTLSKPANGTVEVLANNSIRYIPNNDYLGTDTFKYKVADAQGDADSALVTINVKHTNAVPIAFNDTATTEVNVPVNINVLANDTNLDDGVQSVYVYTQPKHGSVMVNADKTITYTPNNWFLGNDSLKYLVNDVDGDYSIATVYISVTQKVNHVPVAVDDKRATAINLPVEVDVLFNDTGLEDGGIVVESVSAPANGTLVVNASNTITYTPNTDYLGLDAFNYRIYDVDGDVDTATVTINVKETNAIPVAVNDSTITFLNTAVTVDVLANDSGLEDGLAGISIKTQPINGKASINADNTITYIPANWYVGSDELTYTVMDVDGDYDVAQLVIDIRETNEAPVAVNDSYIVNEGDSITIAASGILVNDTDIEGKALAASLIDSTKNGTITLNADGSFKYIHDGSETTADTAKYIVSDGILDGNEALIIFTITPINDAPLAVADVHQIYEDSVFVTDNLLTNDYDVDSDSLAMATLNGHSQIDSVPTQFGYISSLSSGVYNYYLNNNLDTIQNLNAGDTIFETITYTINDGIDTSEVAQLVISIIGQDEIAINNNPTAVNDTVSINEDFSTVSGNMLLNDSDMDGDSIYVTSVNAVILVSGKSLSNYGSIDWNADGSFVYRLNNGLDIVQLLNDGQILTEKFNYEISDINGGVATAQLVINIMGEDDETNLPPTVVYDTVHINYTDFSATINLLENDSDSNGDELIVSQFVNELDENVDKQFEFYDLGGSIDWSHDGTVKIEWVILDDASTLFEGEQVTKSFTHKVSDGVNKSVQSLLTIVLHGAGQPFVNSDPIAINDENSLFEYEASVSGNMLSNDTDADVSDIISLVSVDGINNEDPVLSSYGELEWNSNGSYIYKLDTLNSNVRSLEDDETLTELFEYTIIDNNGGDATATLTITIKGLSTIDNLVISDGFSPNGDGINDEFVIQNIEDYPDNELQVFNRWGSKVYVKKNYDNTWDGRSRQTNTIVPVGTYFYVLFVEGKKHPVKGYVYVNY